MVPYFPPISSASNPTDVLRGLVTAGTEIQEDFKSPVYKWQIMLPHSFRGIMKVTKALCNVQMFSEIPQDFWFDRCLQLLLSWTALYLVVWFCHYLWEVYVSLRIKIRHGCNRWLLRINSNSIICMMAWDKVCACQFQLGNSPEPCMRRGPGGLESKFHNHGAT